MSLDHEACNPLPPFRGGHRQTLAGYLLKSKLLLPFEMFERHEITVPGGDRIVVRLHRGKSQKVIYLFHGLAGNIESNYMRRGAATLIKEGHTVFLVNHRGCGEGAGLAKLPYHSGRAEDISAVIEYGRSIFGSHEHIAIGYSLSGNALLLLCADRPLLVKPDRAISINAPINLKRCVEELQRGWNRIYDSKFFFQSRNIIQNNPSALEFYERLPRIGTVMDIDRIYTAPAGGFADHLAYYAQSSTFLKLNKIRLPTWILTARDDPFVPVEDYENADYSASTRLTIETHGGHLGYLCRNFKTQSPTRWLESWILRAISKQ